MKVKIQVEFEVTTEEDPEESGELTEGRAKSAASEAAWQNLCLSQNGLAVREEVIVHVDGFGECRVKVGEEHE